LLAETGKFPLASCQQIERAPGGNQSVRAFVFERGSKVYVVFWHTSGEGRLELPVEASSVRLLQEIGKPGPAVQGANPIVDPLGNRAYLEFSGKSRNDAVKVIEDARIQG